MNWIHIFFKHGWIFFGAIFLLTMASVYVEAGQDPVLLQWRAHPVVSTIQAILLGVSGFIVVIICLFRFSVDRR